jgi:hypothetical protein
VVVEVLLVVVRLLLAVVLLPLVVVLHLVVALLGQVLRPSRESSVASVLACMAATAARSCVLASCPSFEVGYMVGFHPLNLACHLFVAVASHSFVVVPFGPGSRPFVAVASVLVCMAATAARPFVLSLCPSIAVGYMVGFHSLVLACRPLVAVASH